MTPPKFTPEEERKWKRLTWRTSRFLFGPLEDEDLWDEDKDSRARNVSERPETVPVS